MAGTTDCLQQAEHSSDRLSGNSPQQGSISAGQRRIRSARHGRIRPGNPLQIPRFPLQWNHEAILAPRCGVCSRGLRVALRGGDQGRHDYTVRCPDKWHGKLRKFFGTDERCSADYLCILLVEHWCIYQNRHRLRAHAVQRSSLLCGVFQWSRGRPASARRWTGNDHAVCNK